jgi:hypothetical protein
MHAYLRAYCVEIRVFAILSRAFQGRKWVSQISGSQKNFLRQISCFATSRTAHQTESKSYDGRRVNCLHVLFKFGPKSRFFIRHDVLISDATVRCCLAESSVVLGFGASFCIHCGATRPLANPCLHSNMLPTGSY